MPRFARWAVLGLLGLAAVPATSFAQPAVPTRNIDEPGRNPVQLATSTSCSPNSCILTFNYTVPVGKRLVVQYASVAMNGGVNSFGYLFLQAALIRPADNTAAYLPVPASVGPNTSYYTSSTPLTFFYDSGEAPEMFVGGGNGFVQAFIVGYLATTQ
ncbi:MAG: hypothetical protein JOY70_00105 [Acidisphaera sp.]|nr:hypothetical protein [Acidisphaera sp.]